MILEEGCLINVTLVNSLSVVEGEWSDGSFPLAFFLLRYVVGRDSMLKYRHEKHSVKVPHGCQLMKVTFSY